jgi:hypothetical protein
MLEKTAVIGFGSLLIWGGILGLPQQAQAEASKNVVKWINVTVCPAQYSFRGEQADLYSSKAKALKYAKEGTCKPLITYPFVEGSVAVNGAVDLYNRLVNNQGWYPAIDAALKQGETPVLHVSCSELSAWAEKQDREYPNTPHFSQAFVFDKNRWALICPNQ